MKQCLAEALQWEASKLFTQKACHVFAEKLLEQPEPEGWRFFRVGRRDPLDDISTRDPGKAALHVCIGKNGCYIDVCGRHTEEELLRAWRNKVLARDAEHIEGVFQCSREDLFESVLDPEIIPHEPDAELDEIFAQHRANSSPRSRFGLTIDPEFLNQARKRAMETITGNPSKYGLG